MKESSASNRPKTISELQDWFKANGFDYNKTRCFIGIDFKDPKAFGIYKDDSGEFVVYKNKANGERAIRYQGPDEEYAVIKTHPGVGYDILGEIKSRPDLSIGARWHHERYDGKGYPDHKEGTDIPLYARIIAVADTYDAMTSNRSYRNYLPQDKVRSEIENNMGTQFDPEIARCMIEIIDEDKEYTMHE